MSDAPPPAHSSTPESSSRSAAIAAALGVAAIGVPILGILGNQLGLWAPLIGFYAFALGAGLLAPIALTCGGLALLFTRGKRLAGRERAWIGVGAGLAMVLVLSLAVRPGAGVPPINDITTDLDDPPRFAPAQLVPDFKGRDMSYPDGFAEQVRAAYPDLQPIVLADPPDVAYAKALASAEALGWELHRKDDVATVFDAKESTAIFGFVDDVTVRVRATPNGSRIDVRSKSRDGRSDLGANAARIRRFAEAVKAS